MTIFGVYLVSSRSLRVNQIWRFQLNLKTKNCSFALDYFSCNSITTICDRFLCDSNDLCIEFSLYDYKYQRDKPMYSGNAIKRKILGRNQWKLKIIGYFYCFIFWLTISVFLRNDDRSYWIIIYLKLPKILRTFSFGLNCHNKCKKLLNFIFSIIISVIVVDIKLK